MDIWVNIPEVQYFTFIKEFHLLCYKLMIWYEKSSITLHTPLAAQIILYL